jgi:hypothetical protein
MTWQFRGVTYLHLGMWRAGRRQPAAAEYRAALESLERAVELAPSLGPRLRGAIEEARKRLEQE